MPNTCINEIGQHWFRQWLVAYSTPNHYPNQHWVIVNWAIGNKLQWNMNRNTKLVIHENAFENVASEMAAILSMGSWVYCECPFVVQEYVQKVGLLDGKIFVKRLMQISKAFNKCFPTEWSEFIFVRRAGLLWSQQDFEWRWSVPLFKCLTVLEFSFILFDLCLLITFFNFIMNYIPIVTFWIFTYHKIWILLIMFCFIWSYWIIYFLACLEVSWRVVS